MIKKTLLLNSIFKTMQTVSFKTICQRYPNEWVLLGNPQSIKGSIVLGGVVLYHSVDKKEVCYMGRDKTAGFERIRLVYAGKLPSVRRIGILKRL